MCGKQWNFKQNYIFGIQSETEKWNQSNFFMMELNRFDFCRTRGNVTVKFTVVDTTKMIYLSLHVTF